MADSQNARLEGFREGKRLALEAAIKTLRRGESVRGRGEYDTLVHYDGAAAFLEREYASDLNHDDRPAGGHGKRSR